MRGTPIPQAGADLYRLFAQEVHVQDRLMEQTRDLITDGILERAERESVREEAELMRERLSRLTTPIGVSPHEPSTVRRRGRMRA